MTLQDVLTYLAEELEELKDGGEACPGCNGHGGGPCYVYVDGQRTHGRRCCPDCSGTGKSPAITQAEAALEAVRGAVEREERLRKRAEKEAVAVSDAPYWRGICHSAIATLAILNPVTNGESEAQDQ